MDVTISIPDDVAVKLEERAAVVGQSVPAYTSRLFAETVARPTLDELLAPVPADFARTGMTDDELMDFGRDVLSAVRREQRTVLPPTDADGTMDAIRFGEAALARNIVGRREAVGLTQRALADAAGIRIEQLNRAERGAVFPSTQILAKIHAALAKAGTVDAGICR